MMISKQELNSPLYKVDVEFEECISIEQIRAKISQLHSPQIILWYIGCYGLRKTGVEFYKNAFINPILKKNRDSVFWLIDLTAWNAFRKLGYPLSKTNQCSEFIKNLSRERIQLISSADIFKKIQNIKDKNIIHYFRKALSREFINISSKNYFEIGIEVKEIFPSNCLFMENWANQDVSKAYSIFQYLEGCLLIEEIFIYLLKVSLQNSFEIVFLLPNDELKYYKDDCGSFQKDLEFLLSNNCSFLNRQFTQLKIKFLSFKYGAEIHHRPYNAPGSVLKKHNLSCEDIMGDFWQTETLEIYNYANKF